MPATDYDEFSARAEGWIVVNMGHKGVQLQKYDADQRFEDDGEAWKHVVAKAREGSKLHRAALDLCSQDERAKIKAHCGEWS